MKDKKIIKVFIITGITAVFCLVLAVYAKVELSDDDYLLFIYIISLFGISNYLLIGMPEYIIANTVKSRVGALLHAKIIHAFALLSCLALGILCAGYFVLDFIFSDQNFQKALIFQIFVFIPQSYIIFHRSIYESQYQQVESNKIKSIVMLSIYSLPLHAEYVTYAAFNLFVLLLVGLYLYNNHKYQVCKSLRHSKRHSFKNILLKGSYLNGVWSYTQVVSLAEKMIITSFDKSFGVEFSFVSDMIQRISILYGTLGQYYLPILAKLKENLKFKIVNSEQIKIFVQFFIFIAFVGLIDMWFFNVYLFFPIDIAIYTDNFYYLLIIFLFNGLLSLTVRPIYIIEESKKQLILLFVIGATYIAVISNISGSFIMQNIFVLLMIRVFIEYYGSKRLLLWKMK